MYGLPYYERGNRAMHGEVVPYTRQYGIVIVCKISKVKGLVKSSSLTSGLTANKYLRAISAEPVLNFCGQLKKKCMLYFNTNKV